MRNYSSVTDLAASLAEGLGLDEQRVTEAIRSHRQTFGRYEDIDDATYEILSRRVWAEITDAAWPF